MKWFPNLKLLVCTLALLTLSVTSLKADDEKNVKRAVERLNALIRQNALNDSLGQSHLNHYVFSLEEDPNAHVKRRGTSFIRQGTIDAIETNLVNLSKPDQGNIHFYVALNGEHLSVENLDDQQGAIEAGKLSAAIYKPIENKIKELLNKIYNQSQLKNLGNGRNALLGITPIKRILIKGNDNKSDKLYYNYLRHTIEGEAFKQLVEIVNTKNQSLQQYSRNPDEALIAHNNLYLSVMMNYESELNTAIPCGQMLQVYADHPFLREGNYFRPIVLKNPCVFEGMHKIGEGLGYETQWMKDFNRVFGAGINIALLPAVAAVIIPVLAEVGIVTLEEAAQIAAQKKTREFAVGFVVDGAFQVLILSLDKQLDQITVNDLSLSQMAASGLENTLENKYAQVASSCLYDGVTENGVIDPNLNIEKFCNDCAWGVLSAVVAESITNGKFSGGSETFKRLNVIANASTKKLVKGLLKIGVDHGNVIRFCRYFDVKRIDIDIADATPALKAIMEKAQVAGLRIKVGTTDKIAVIGRNMVRVTEFGKSIGGVVGDGIFNPSKQAIEELQKGNKKLLMDENTAWVKKIKDEGYTIYDVGLDPKYTSAGDYFDTPYPKDFDKGQYYGMETKEIFGDELVGGAENWINEITAATKKHVLKGEINISGNGVGCHFKGALDNGTARIRPNTFVIEGPNDMFKAYVDIRDSNGNWIPKTAQSTFFPRLWSEQKILTEIQVAFGNRTFVSGNMWTGLSSEGIEIGMFLKTDGTNLIISAFPIF